MFVFVYPACSLLLATVITQAQFHLYHTDRDNESNFQFDCLYYNQSDKDVEYDEYSERHNTIIPYCIRPSNESTMDNHSSEVLNSQATQIKFEELRKQNISSAQLYRWTIPIDLLERYQIYLDNPTKFASEGSQIFYNCSAGRFGTICEYTFDPYRTLSEAIHATFSRSRVSSTDILSYTNGTCYIHLKCNHASPVPCLDWREICDGKTDCIDGSDEEKHCFELEINKCADNEYRCHNGAQCITDDFFRDNRLNPDCSDQSDEPFFNELYYLSCYMDPSFRCEERHCPDSLEFSCGDGQCRNTMAPGGNDFCVNGRNRLSTRVLLSSTTMPYLLPQCIRAMSCVTWYHTRPESIFEENNCSSICDFPQRSCADVVRMHCPSSLFQFPAHPVIFNHVRFIWTRSPTSDMEQANVWKPEFVCYDEILCPFVVQSIQIENLTCQHWSTIFFEDSYNDWQLLLEDVRKTFRKCAVFKIQCQGDMVFYCNQSAKCISKYRVFDGIQDCYGFEEEQSSASCLLNDKYRYQCPNTEDMCLSPRLVQNDHYDCPGNEDEEELFVGAAHAFPTWATLCDGFEEFSIRGTSNETDETNCEYWPCNNQYTRCNGIWNCRDGADEANCSLSICPSQTHICISPTETKITCLPLERANNGVVDCRGASDERFHCQDNILIDASVHNTYRCWNSSQCISSEKLCNKAMNCKFDDDENFCEQDGFMDTGKQTDAVTRCESDQEKKLTMIQDFFCKLSNFKKAKYTYFAVADSTTNDSISLPIANSTASASEPEVVFLMPGQQQWYCNRGVLANTSQAFLNNTKTYCLCPPSYYGDRCQFQNQRVSLTIQIRPISDWRMAFIFVAILLDDIGQIHSYDQIMYTHIHDCRIKFNTYLLYQSYPKKMNRNYSVRIDAFEKLTLLYRGSWFFSLPFPFLPVHRLAAQVIIPVSTSHGYITNDCSSRCDHGHCTRYVNKQKSFCYCAEGYSGRHCSIKHNCTCSANSFCLGVVQKRSICVCRLEVFGPRCYLKNSICQMNPCRNNGSCVPSDERILGNSFVCICLDGFSGPKCEHVDTRIDISIPENILPSQQFILAHFITVRKTAQPLRATIPTKISYDSNIATIYTSIIFHVIFIEIAYNYYLAHVQHTYVPSVPISTVVERSHRCHFITELLSTKQLDTPQLRSVKFYHIPCRSDLGLICFYDLTFLCLCNEDRFANCLPFDHNMTYACEGNNYCDNGGKCFRDHPKCPTSSMCVCPECFYGARCQFSSRGFGLSLDAILGYSIHPNVPFSRQPFSVQASAAITSIIFVLGFVNGVFSILTFVSKHSRQVGCGNYLLVSSITSFLTIIVLQFKFWFLVLTQMASITDRAVFVLNCVSIDVLLRILLSTNDWMTACVAMERVFTMLHGVNFSRAKSKFVAKWIISAVIVFTVGTASHDPFYRHLVYHEDEQRTWCLVRYSSNVEVYNSIIVFVHFFVPFAINSISAALIIILMARKRVTANHEQQNFTTRLHAQLSQHKHLLISPCILVVCALSRLVNTFISNCMNSTREPWLFLGSFFISFVPALLIFVVFVLPSTMYRKDFKNATKHLNAACRPFRALNKA